MRKSPLRQVLEGSEIIAYACPNPDCGAHEVWTHRVRPMPLCPGCGFLMVQYDDSRATREDPYPLLFPVEWRTFNDVRNA